MDLFDTRLRQGHRASSKLLARGCGLTAALHRPLVYGTRALCWPAMSLTTDLSMGPARHTLAQMVVAGTVQYLPPFPPPARPSAPISPQAEPAASETV